MQVTRCPSQAESFPPNLPIPIPSSLYLYSHAKGKHGARGNIIFCKLWCFYGSQSAKASSSLVTMATMLRTITTCYGKAWTVQWCYVCLLVPAEKRCAVLQLSSRAVSNFPEEALQRGVREHKDLVFSLCLAATDYVNLLAMVVGVWERETGMQVLGPALSK